MNLKITRQRNIYFAFSAFMVALAIGAMIFKGFNLGIDFKGGQLLQLKFEKARKLLSMGIDRCGLR